MTENNFDEQNIAEIRAIIEKERTDGPVIDRAFTMLQINSPCGVEITEASRKICAEALLK